ncbi:MAG: DUF116 domain-containing protein [Candidatus Schekmanbacteria bacterium]|nr:DUF116 domain-containing protein [Candidatus Schekmanbacteria bacterium]
MKLSNKGLFSWLCIGVISALVLLSLGIFKFSTSPAFEKYFAALNMLLISGITFVCIMTLFLLAGIFLDTNIPFASAFRKIYIKLLFPMLMMCGKLFKVSKERLEQVLIEINNKLVLSKKIKVAPHELLILLPHCLQRSECDKKLTYRLDNCIRCGGCVINELLSLGICDEVRFAMARGGTEARNVINSLHPRAVVAVACERDLISGIIDSYPLSVYGIVNERPFGYCKDTCINVQNIKEGIDLFLN